VQSGTIAGQPYRLATDTATGDGDLAWVCVDLPEVGEVRLRTSAEVLDFESDIPLPYSPTPSGPGPTASCVGGERRADLWVAGIPVSLYDHVEGDRTHVCLGAGSETRRITSDTGELAEVGLDTTGCTFDVFTTSNPVVKVQTSPLGATPASACVTVGTTSVRVTVGGDDPLVSTGTG